MYHFHDSRRSLENVLIGDLEMELLGDRMVISVGEVRGNIWMGRLGEE